jgi:hypothetical protein
VPNRSSKRPRDVNQLAYQIVQEATGNEPKQPPDTRNPHAVALGSLGGKKGGRARAEKLTPEQRREIAQKAAAKRWAKPVRVQPWDDAEVAACDHPRLVSLPSFGGIRDEDKKCPKCRMEALPEWFAEDRRRKGLPPYPSN